MHDQRDAQALSLLATYGSMKRIEIFPVNKRMPVSGYAIIMFVAFTIRDADGG